MILKAAADLLLGGAAADVEEVGRFAAVVFDDVHGGHGEAGAVDEAGDVAVEADVVEVVFGGGDFARVLLVLVAHRLDFRVAVERVVVEVELGVERVNVVVGGDDDRVDLDHRAIAVDEQFVERVEQAAELAGGGGEAEVVAELADLVGLQAGERVDELAEDFLRGFRRLPRCPCRLRWRR
jgi:hypothetical protein